MSKYIRTKDNIYEIVNDYGSSCAIKSKGKRGRTAIDGFTIKYGLSYAPRADTIEELCDEAVFFDKDNVPHYKSKEGNVWYLGAGLFTESLRFGIFTDKGLIYVAKINEKGDLELL